MYEEDDVQLEPLDDDDYDDDGEDDPDEIDFGDDEFNLFGGRDDD